jgi:hypothetical protein
MATMVAWKMSYTLGTYALVSNSFAPENFTNINVFGLDLMRTFML